MITYRPLVPIVEREVGTLPRYGAVFWRALDRRPLLRTNQALGAALGVTGHTLEKRFRRAGLAPPRALLDDVAMLRLIERVDAGECATHAGLSLGWSSGNALTRHLRTRYGTGARQLRGVTPDEWCERIANTWIRPHRALWRDPATCWLFARPSPARALEPS